MIYWYENECSKIIFEDAGDKTINEILNNIKNDLWVHDFDSAGEDEYEFVFYDNNQIVEIINLTHEWCWRWDKELYENYSENSFYITNIKTTTHPQLTDLDYILRYKMNII